MKILRPIVLISFSAAIAGVVLLSTGMDYGDMSMRNLTVSGTTSGVLASPSPAASTDSEIVVFSGTDGNATKRSNLFSSTFATSSHTHVQANITDLESTDTASFLGTSTTNISTTNATIANVFGGIRLDSQVVITGTTQTDTPSAAHGNVSQPIWIAKTSSGVVTSEIRAPTSSGSLFVGKDAARSSYGQNLTAIGANAGYMVKAQDNAVYIGYSAGYYQYAGSSSLSSYNTGIGVSALAGGSSSPTTNTGTYNTGVGASVLNSVTSGSYNSGFGTSSLVSNTTGVRNSGIGSGSGFSNTVGSYNTFLGSISGRYCGTTLGSTTEMTSVDYGVYIGYNSHGSAATGVTNEIAIGANSVGKGSDTAVLGNLSTNATYLYGDLIVDSPFATSSPALYVDSENDRVGIGTASPAQLVALESSNTTGTAVNIINTSSGGYNWNIFSCGSAGTIAAAGSLAFRDSTNGVTRMYISGGGGIYRADNGQHFDTTSDARLKDDIQPIIGALETVCALQGRTWKWKPSANKGDTNKRHSGFVAQEVEQVLPDWVSTGEDGTKSVGIKNDTALFVEAIKALNAKIEALENRIKVLEAK